MLCNLCNKNQATVHLTEIIDNQMSELHLCDDCAKKKSMQMEQQFGLSDLLAGLVDYGKQFSSAEKEAIHSAECGNCGLTYEDFRKIGRLGCSECYVSFSRHLGPLLKRIHGSIQHMGKAPLPVAGAAPPAARPQSAQTSDLKAKLEKAIEREEFEEAARLRDAIKNAETLNTDKNNKENEKKKKTSYNEKETRMS